MHGTRRHFSCFFFCCFRKTPKNWKKKEESCSRKCISHCEWFEESKKRGISSSQRPKISGRSFNFHPKERKVSVAFQNLFLGQQHQQVSQHLYFVNTAWPAFEKVSRNSKNTNQEAYCSNIPHRSLPPPNTYYGIWSPSMEYSLPVERVAIRLLENSKKPAGKSETHAPTHTHTGGAGGHNLPANFQLIRNGKTANGHETVFRFEVARGAREFESSRVDAWWLLFPEITREKLVLGRVYPKDVKLKTP